MAALLSHKMVVGLGREKSMPARSVRSQIASLHDSYAAVYSASQEDDATVFCFWQLQDMIPDPSEKA